jgi:hypothetical protein
MKFDIFFNELSMKRIPVSFDYSPIALPQDAREFLVDPDELIGRPNRPFSLVLNHLGMKKPVRFTREWSPKMTILDVLEWISSCWRIIYEQEKKTAPEREWIIHCKKIGEFGVPEIDRCYLPDRWKWALIEGGLRNCRPQTNGIHQIEFYDLEDIRFDAFTVNYETGEVTTIVYP